MVQAMMMQKVAGVGMPGRRLDPALWTALCQATITCHHHLPCPKSPYIRRQAGRRRRRHHLASLCWMALRPRGAKKTLTGPAGWA